MVRMPGLPLLSQSRARACNAARPLAMTSVLELARARVAEDHQAAFTCLLRDQNVGPAVAVDILEHETALIGRCVEGIDFAFGPLLRRILRRLVEANLRTALDNQDAARPNSSAGITSLVSTPVSITCRFQCRASNQTN